MTARQLLTFTPVALALLAIPGPSVMFVVTRGVVLGRRAALATMAGNELGLFCHVIAVALGIGAIVQRSLIVFTLMKLAGACYLVWLGVRTIRDRRHLQYALGRSAEARSTRRLVRDGFIVGVSNPKTTLFFLAVLPQFVEPQRGHVVLQLLVLGLAFVALAIMNDSLYGLAAGSVRRWLSASPRRSEALGGASGLVMISFGVHLAVTGRH